MTWAGFAETIHCNATDITYLPASTVVSIPTSITGDFRLSCTIINKFNGQLVYESVASLTLTAQDILALYKVLNVSRELKTFISH